MPRLIVTPKAAAGLERCRTFLQKRNPLSAQKASLTIKDSFMLLESEPEIGRLFGQEKELRELIIPFGDSGYVALYVFDAEKDEVLILAFRHQKEVGY